MTKKLVVGITAAGSVGLLPGQLKYFKEQGYDTYLLAPRSERSEAYCEREGCTLLEVELEREISIIKDLKSLFKVLKIMRRVKPDIVNLGTPKVALLGLIAARITGVPKRIYTCRGLRYEHEQGMLRKILVLMEKITAFCAHRVICISDSVKKLGLNDRLFKEEKAVVINKGSSNGINLAQFDPSKISLEAKEALRSKLQLDGMFVFGFLGRIIDRKGIRALVDAFTRFYEEQPNSRLLIVGPVEAGQLKDESVMDEIEEHPGIIWPGRTDEVPLHLAIMDVFVLPAWWEGFGNVLVQAAAMGVPVISTTGTGTIDAVSDGFNGILVPIKTVEPLQEAMAKLYLDSSLRNEMAANSVIWSRNFSNELIWKGMNQLYLQ